MNLSISTYQSKSSINTIDRSSSTNGPIQSSCLVGNSSAGFYSSSIAELSYEVTLGYVRLRLLMVSYVQLRLVMFSYV